MLPLSFIGGLAAATLNQRSVTTDLIFPFPVLVVLGIIAVVSTPFVVAALISFQSINPLSDRLWTPPTHDDNPCHWGNPLKFFHFVGPQISACGLGMVIAAMWTHAYFLVIGGLTVLGGLAALIGVHLAMRFCKDKVQQ